MEAPATLLISTRPKGALFSKTQLIRTPHFALDLPSNSYTRRRLALDALANLLTFLIGRGPAPTLALRFSVDLPTTLPNSLPFGLGPIDLPLTRICDVRLC